MDDRHDLELLIQSHVPLISIETREERRVLGLLGEIQKSARLPLYTWSITEGMQRLMGQFSFENGLEDPTQFLEHIKRDSEGGLFALLDFHPYLEDPRNVRLLKDIALQQQPVRRVVVLISHAVEVPDELHAFHADFHLALPSHKEREKIIREEARQWKQHNAGRKVKADSAALERLIDNLGGLTTAEVRRLARKAICDDGAILDNDIARIVEAKYRLLNRDSLLRYEFATERFADVAGFSHLKDWLAQRAEVFRGGDDILDVPRGVLLLGVQGCGKSLAARAVAGTWQVPLLHLDFGALFNKYHGETERNLREVLRTAEAMAPCVLWIDEIEKGIAGTDRDGGTARRLQATLLTWMAERKQAVFMVATANDITMLPPELVRKGRFDEIFFVDLPDAPTRRAIFEIHLRRREQPPALFDLDALAAATADFSGSEIEQLVVAALYSARGRGTRLSQSLLLEEAAATRPLAVTMAEPVARLRQWAEGRTVPAD
ncbi:MAG TPA: AAA family ATPase [Gammaproteobacteria bacterium]|nr:AAA family ATPase [Gammaproteobacteria bacterium]